MDMRGTEGGKRRRHRCWKATGVLLLGLMGGSAGCQWIGHPTAATVTGERGYVSAPRGTLGALTQPRLPEANTILSGRTADAGTEPSSSAPTSASSGLIQTSYRSNPDGPSTEDKDVVRREMAAPHSLAARVAAPAADNPANEEKNKAKEQRSQRRNAEKDEGYQVDLTLPSPAKGMDTPVIPAPQNALPLTLAESLALAGAANPVIALAQQAVRLSQAELFQARLLLVPSVNVGANYDLHNGPLQSSFGAIRKVDRQAVLYGLGAYSVAAETVKIPGLFIFTPLTDAFFNPLVARQVVANRRFASAATNNQVLLEVATDYLALLGAEAHLAVIRQSEADFNEVVRLTAVFAKRGARREADANRARADALALQYAEQQAQEEVAVASSELARLLNLDPSIRLQTGDIPIQVITFVDPKIPLPKLLEIAARNRPEVLAAAAAIRASQVRVKQEKVRPLLPTLWAGFSADDFGGGTVATTSGNVPNPHTGNIPPVVNGLQGPKFGRINGRTDVDVIFFWTLQNAGFGNIAHVKERRAELNQAQAERLRVLNEVAREVSEAYNTSAQQFLAIGIERQRVQEVSAGFQLDLERIRKAPETGRPIEVLDQAKRLFSARQDLLAAIIGFDRAQFQLFVALGQPPTLVVEDDKPPADAPPAELPPAELPPPQMLPPEKK
jgi:outer membrane protein TolC